MLTAQMLCATAAMRGPIGGAPRRELRRSFALHMATRTRLPLAASASASAAHTVVLPTPPLPVTRTNRLSASVDIAGAEPRIARKRMVSLGASTDAPLLAPLTGRARSKIGRARPVFRPRRSGRDWNELPRHRATGRGASGRLWGHLR